MTPLIKKYAAVAAFFMVTLSMPALAQTRLALVIGNSSYPTAPLATGANDAGLIAKTLQQSGFDVTAASDLSLDALRGAFRDFLGKAQAAGPDSVLFVYLAGRGLQYLGDDFFVPVDAAIHRDTDVPLAALRLSDYLQAFAALPAQARIFVLDAARSNGFIKPGAAGALAGGLSLIEPPQGALYAENAAPGTIAPDEPGPYGVYARALVEMMEDGLSVNDVFARARLRVNEATQGAVVPWDDSKITVPVSFFVRESNAPAVPSLSAYQNRPLASLPPAEAYLLVVDRDTISGYEAFLAAFPRDPFAPRVRALLAARREALSWWRAYSADTPSAYWGYMGRYPHGPHFWDARRRLMMLRAALEPPPNYVAYDFGGLPPPPPDEYEIVDQPVIILDEPRYGQLPLPPAAFLPAEPDRFRHLPPPHPASRGAVPLPAADSAPDVRPAARPGAISAPPAAHPATPGHAAPNAAVAPTAAPEHHQPGNAGPSNTPPAPNGHPAAPRGQAVPSHSQEHPAVHPEAAPHAPSASPSGHSNEHAAPPPSHPAAAHEAPREAPHPAPPPPHPAAPPPPHPAAAPPHPAPAAKPAPPPGKEHEHEGEK